MTTTVDWRGVGQRLRIARGLLGMTQAEAAETYGVTLRTYRNYEAGGTQRWPDPAVTFCETTGVPFGWLIFDAGPGIQRVLH
jgi:transcriptional regulator with XRE-family HTH domain